MSYLKSKQRRVKLSENIYQLVKKILPGRVSTYGEIDRALGNVNLARAVGNILNKNPQLVIVPCHRVVKANGGLGGFSQGQKIKQKFLVKEGVVILSNKVVDLKKRLFKFS